MSNETVITIKGRRGRGGERKGPVRPLGRSEYLARRLSESTAPFFVSFWSAGLTSGTPSTVIDFNEFNLGENWWLRPDDVVVLVVLSADTVTIGSGYQALVTGDCSIYWRRWKAGDPTSVAVDLTSGTRALVRLMVLRNAASSGNPFTAPATKSGTGRVVTLPSVKAAKDDLCIHTWWQGGAIPPSPLPFPDVPFVNTNAEYGDEFFSWQSSVTNVGPVAVAKYQKAGPTLEFYIGVYTESGPWTGVSVAVRPRKPLARVLAGPHSDTRSGFSPEYFPLIIPGDIVVTYVVSNSPTITIPTAYGDGWEHVAGSPLQNGSKYLHVYWKRWTQDDAYDVVDYSATGFMRLLTVARGARKRGNPFGSVAFSTGSGTSVTGSAVSTAKDQLVFFAAVASTFTGGNANALGPITPQGVTEFEIDADSDSLFFYSWQYRTSSGYASGTSAGPFTAAFNKSAAELWTVTFTVLR